jgi:pimeloyl-ACP methyl ester carboxylesterase
MKWDAARNPSVPGDQLTATYRQPGVVLTDRYFTVPLDHDDPAGETIELYAREVVASDKAQQNLPWMVYLQGGPGFGANRFVGKQAWLGRALKDHRVLLLDQRGTGHSTPANRQTLPLRGGPAEQADYLAHFRADAIVRDCGRSATRSPAAPPGPHSARASAASARSTTSRPPPRASPPP